MAEDAGAAEVAVVGVVILDGIEDDGEAWVLAAYGYGSFDTVHLSGKLHVHEDGVGTAGEGVVEGLFAALAGMGDMDAICGFQAGFEGEAQVVVVFYQE